MRTPFAYAAHLLLVVLLAVGAWAMAFTTDIRDSGMAGILLKLPNQIDDWNGSEILYCQNPACQRVSLRERDDELNQCPACGGALSGGSLTEWSLLPPDTGIHKKQYTKPGTPPRLGSIVLSGSSRTSIHRPQICLVGEGREIVKTTVIPVDLPGRQPLFVTVLDMLNRSRLPDGRWQEYGSYYAYWFVSPHRETPYHSIRMLWMAYDQVFRGESHRWAYISVSGYREQASTRHLDEAAEFIAALYPALALPDAPTTP